MQNLREKRGIPISHPLWKRRPFLKITSLSILYLLLSLLVSCNSVSLPRTKTMTLTIDSVGLSPKTSKDGVKSTAENEKSRPSPSATALPTITDTTIPETPMQTSEPGLTPTRTATWTPVPTLSEEVRKENLIHLFTTNGGCEYPCFWGVKPGSPIQDVIDLTSTLGKAPIIYNNQYTFRYSLDELNLGDFSLDINEDEGVVQKITTSLIDATRHKDFMEAFNMSLSLSSILTQYGQPDSVLLQIQPRTEKDSPIGYTLYLLYIREGFAVWYDGVVISEIPFVFVYF